MIKKHKVVFLILSSLVAGLVFIVFAGNKRSDDRAQLSHQASPVGVTPMSRNNYVRRSKLRPSLMWALSQLGDRLERPGRERLAAGATIQYGNQETPQALILLNEFPDRLRVSVKGRSSERTLVFDRDRGPVTSSLNDVEEGLLETLIYDSVEHFFWSQAQQQATRFIGSRVRTDDGSNPEYSGQFYDVYQVTESIRISPGDQVRSKFYYFNSDTLLLERVVYETNSQSPTKIEVLLSHWKSVNNQRVPHRIERLENGVSRFVISLDSVNLAPRVDDGSFDQTTSN